MTVNETREATVAANVRDPIRIAQVLNRMDSGGIEMVLVNYYRAMNHAQIQFDFYYADTSSIPNKKALQEMGAGMYPIPSYTKPLAYHHALYSAFKEKGYQIVHVHLNTMSVFALFAAWRAGVPVRICHNHSTAHWSEGWVTILKYVLRPFNKVLANRYFACGRVAGRWLYGRRCMSHGLVTIIPNAIDTRRFAYDKMARVQLRKEFEIDENAYVIGHVGRFCHQKNHRFLLYVFKNFLLKNPHAILLLIGEGKMQKEIRALAASLDIGDRVIFAGVRSDANKLYSVMDVFCLPSYYEGMPLVAWEAQCNGLPCLLSDQVTQEAALRKDVRFLPLERKEEWVEALLYAKRSDMPIADQIDISRCCRKLEALYLAETMNCAKGHLK